MRDLDIGRFLRLRQTIIAATDALTDIPATDVSSVIATSSVIAETYEGFRLEALDLVPEEHLEEYLRVCPPIDDKKLEEARSSASSEPPIAIFAEATARLRALSGFLDGYVQETQLRMEAEERVRLAQESGGQYL